MELRKDYILDRWVIISESRKNRPMQFKENTEPKFSPTCAFCAGAEKLTPEEKGRIGEPWKVRWFNNLYPFAEMKGTRRIETHNKYFTFGNPYGTHEIVVDTPDHNRQMWDLSEEELVTLFTAYRMRIEELQKDSEYVVVFKNHGKEGGASLLHSHSQIVSTNFIPPLIRQEAEASRGCKYCEILNVEKGSDRRVRETSAFVSFTPYASRFGYELWIFPKRHFRHPSDMSAQETAELASHIRSCLQTLKKLDLPFNICFHYAPKGDDLHFHVEVLPRAAIWAGFEFTTSVTINPVSPEYAARVYRGEDDPSKA